MTKHYKSMRCDLGPLSCVIMGGYRASFNEEAMLFPQVSELETEQRMQSQDDAANMAANSGLGSVIEAGTGTPLSETAVFHMLNKDTGTTKLRHWTRWWLSRFGYCLLADYRPGYKSLAESVLNDVKIERLGPLLLKFEHQNQAGLQAGVTLLSRLRDMVSEAGGPCIATLIPPQRVQEIPEMTLNVYRAKATVPVMWPHQRTEFWS